MEHIDEVDKVREAAKEEIKISAKMRSGPKP